MTQYIRQEDRYSCGPVVLQNAIIWAGIKDSRFSYTKIHEMCHCEPTRGTLTQSLYGTLQFIIDRSSLCLDKFAFTPTINEIIKHLKAGGVIILKYHWEQVAYSGEHYVLISEMIDDKFALVNDDNPYADYPIIEYVPLCKIEKYLSPYEYKTNDKYSEPEDRKYPCAWFLHRH